MCLGGEKSSAAGLKSGWEGEKSSASGLGGEKSSAAGRQREKSCGWPGGREVFMRLADNKRNLLRLD